MITMNALPLPERSVTGWDIMAEVTAMRRDVGTVLTKVEVMSAQQQLATAQMSDIETRLRLLQAAVPDQLAPRLTAVERWQWRTGGALAAAALIFGIIGGYIGVVLGHIH